jgi:YtoQ family protein
MIWNVYLSGEIHSQWRQLIIEGANSAGLPVEFSSPVLDHAASDDAGDVLGEENEAFWKDHKSSKINAIRTRTMLNNADLVIVRFGEKFKQWNAAFDAGYAAALGTPYITLHDESLIHPLKEVDAAALAWAQTPEQIVEILKYTCPEE